MTVSSTTTKVSYSGDGSTTVFAYSFKIFADADLRVIERASDGTETVKSLTTHYTVSGAGTDSGGNVTFGTAPASGVTVIIKRNLTLTQGTDYVANDPFPAESHEQALDRLTFIAQGIQEELDRTIKASETNTISGAEFTVSASDRANKVFAFDASGDLAVTQEIGTFRGDWAASTAYKQRDLVKDTSTNNIFIVNTAHTSSGAQPLTTNANSAKYDLIVDAASATTSATNAAASATTATTQASTATTKAAEAATSATASAASATAAAASETAAAASETASAASETASAASETASAASQTAAAASATSASSSASTATTKASEASTSATTATTKATEAASSATTASTQASNASTSASTATTKASEASTSATNAASSATAAASSATAAAASQTAAAASAASAATAFDNFDDTYLGSKTSNPAQDNDGNPLVSGALYFNSTANEMRVYDGANWIAATSAGNVSLILYEYTATAGQTTFSGSDDNSATLSYTADNLQVVMNGVVLDPSDFTATNGTSVVLASGAATADLINIYAFKSFTTADMVSKTNGGTFSGAVGFSGGITGDVAFDTNTLKVDSSNNRVGVGTAAPADELHINSTAANVNLRLTRDTNTGCRLSGSDGGTTPSFIVETIASGTATERMRIDSSGNLLVGKTAEGANNIGFQARPDGFFSGTRDGGTVSYLQRQTSDGEVLRFQKDGGTVGSIGTSAGLYLYLGTDQGSDCFIRFVSTSSSSQLRPANAAGNNRDNIMDLGASNSRWDDIFATNGTIQTSDQNEKQDIASLTAAEITAAKAISKLFKTFKWNDKVAAKGDAARTHTGVIAQEVQTAMTDAGLDASNYAFWCSNTFWEADGETYDTADEAPDGATQRTRLGIRYPELLAFIGAATEQRLANIETRLTALEAGS